MKKSNMFDLEQAIADWRKQMLAAGIKTPAPLEELESHLHEDVAQQMREGIEAQPAFEAAVQKIGQPHVLKSEFQKTNALTVERKRTLAIAAGVLTVLVGFILEWATVVQSRDVGKMTSEVVELLVLGLILVFAGGGISFLASKRKA